MEKKNSNKLLFTILFILPVVLVIAIFLLALKPWETYKHSGPLANGNQVKITASNVKAGTGVILGGLKLVNQSNSPVTVISIQPSDTLKGVTFTELGVTDKKIKIKSESEVNNLDIKKLPFIIPGGSSTYQPVVKLSSDMHGTFEMSGLIITYKYKNTLYRDFFDDQFTVHFVK